MYKHKYEWQLQHAKARFSEVVREAKVHGPQIITVHDKPSVVVISMEEYQKIKLKPKKIPSLLEVMQEGRQYGLKIEADRSSMPERKVFE